jgi:hypothetical protein
MSDDYIDRIERFLAQHHITAYRYERRSKHRSVVIMHGGKVTTIFFPTSGSDWRGHRRVVAKMRHALGLVGMEGAA